MKQPHWDCGDLVNCAVHHLTTGSYVGNGRGWDGCIVQVKVFLWSIQYRSKVTGHSRHETRTYRVSCLESGMYADYLRLEQSNYPQD